MLISVKLLVSSSSHEQDYQKLISSLLSHLRILVGDNRRTTRSLQYPFDQQDVVKRLNIPDSLDFCVLIFMFTRQLLLLQLCLLRSFLSHFALCFSRFQSILSKQPKNQSVRDMSKGGKCNLMKRRLDLIQDFETIKTPEGLVKPAQNWLYKCQFFLQILSARFERLK